jgi:hypothetical protein
MRTASQGAETFTLSITANRAKRNGIVFAEAHRFLPAMPPTARINAAIRDCLDSLQPGRPPLDHLATFLERLRAERSFTQSEIHEVETTVRRILSNLIVEEPLE